MLGGLAAGLGLAWLASSLGLGAEFAQFLLIGLVVLLGFVLFAAYKRSRQNAASAGAIRSPYALQSAGHAPPASVDTAAARSYNPAKIGNDASARPWEQQGLAGSGSGTASGSMIGAALRSPLEGSQTWGIPADFDVNGFVEAAKRNFVTLQAAWDRSDITTLRSMMTDDMLREIRTQLEEREKINPNASGQTDVMMLNAQLLGIEDLGSHHMASVEFSGMIREDQTAGPAPFREVWNMTKAKDGSSGWLVAGLQALE
jgi:predicted lipid-binding transport protein (Tim44 family)